MKQNPLNVALAAGMFLFLTGNGAWWGLDMGLAQAIGLAAALAALAYTMRQDARMARANDIGPTEARDMARLAERYSADATGNMTIGFILSAAIFLAYLGWYGTALVCIAVAGLNAALGMRMASVMAQGHPAHVVRGWWHMTAIATMFGVLASATAGAVLIAGWCKPLRSGWAEAVFGTIPKAVVWDALLVNAIAFAVAAVAIRQVAWRVASRIVRSAPANGAVLDLSGPSYRPIKRHRMPLR
jgi:hypothetical protein